MDRITACKAFAGAVALFATEGESVADVEPNRGSSKVRVLLQQPLPNVSGKELTLIHVHYGPGAGSAAHRHPGFTLGYVLEGRIVSQVAGGPARTYAAGDFFVEHPGDAHLVSRNGSSAKTASLLAFLITDVGAKLVQPLSRNDG